MWKIHYSNNVVLSVETENDIDLKHILINYHLPLFLGAVGMIICHFFILLAFVYNFRFPIYIYTYPVIYPILTIIMYLISRTKWKLIPVLVCALPTIYWYGLLIKDNRLSFFDANIRTSGGMSLVMPGTIVVCYITMYMFVLLKNAVSKNKKS